MSDELEAGPTMDRLIAEKVMGWTSVKFRPYSPGCQSDDATHAHWWGIRPGGGQGDIPEYSTDIRYAWEVVEKIAGTSTDVHVGKASASVAYNETIYECEIYYGPDRDMVRMVSNTAPLAICRASLAAVTIAD